MTENSQSGDAGKTHNSSRNPALEGDSGQYVEGDYGDAGVTGQESATEPEGEYPAGDYGDAGVVKPSAEVEEGEYPEGDYGRAGSVGQELPGEEEGEYPEGDYGAAGTSPEGGAAEDLKDELIDGQVNAPRNDDGGTSSGG
ncbi:hypothetical protein [uncultured Arthrobacter sp.]|uniref:hypothetical protein n=1 Tax=uncultured Arthrobacter sp. TaxID=114050 RepID=UPI0028D10E10|nr:hypothetical protein [uncultured Arthrobacter sp.]